MPLMTTLLEMVMKMIKTNLTKNFLTITSLLTKSSSKLMLYFSLLLIMLDGTLSPSSDES